MNQRKIDVLKEKLEKIDYAADAVAMNQDSAIKIKHEFQQEFEKDFVAFTDLEDYFGVKILLTHDFPREEFELYKRKKIEAK